MHVVIAGAGGVGGYFGAKLAQAGERVTVLARGAHRAAIRDHGLRVRSSVEGEFVARVEVPDDLEATPPADAILLCVKSFDTAAALHAVRPVVAATTPILSLQNGVESVEIIETLLGRGHALGGAAYVFATIESPGVIGHRFAGRIVFGELDGSASARARALRDALARATVPVELSTDVHRVLWEKYLLITAQAGMTAVTRCPVGVLRATPETWAMYRAIVEELGAVAKAAGVALPPDAVERTMTAAAAIAPGNFSSLHHDLVNGKRLELETLHGYAVRLGARLGVPTPMISAVYAALKPHVNGSHD